MTANDGTRLRALFRVIVIRWRCCGHDLVADIGEELCVVYKIMLGVTGGLHEDSLFASIGDGVLREIVRTVEGLVSVTRVVARRLHEIRASELGRGAVFRGQRRSFCFKSLHV